MSADLEIGLKHGATEQFHAWIQPEIERRFQNADREKDCEIRSVSFARRDIAEGERGECDIKRAVM